MPVLVVERVRLEGIRSRGPARACAYAREGARRRCAPPCGSRNGRRGSRGTDASAVPCVALLWRLEVSELGPLGACFGGWARGD